MSSFESSFVINSTPLESDCMNFCVDSLLYGGITRRKAFLFCLLSQFALSGSTPALYLGASGRFCIYLCVCVEDVYLSPCFVGGQRDSICARKM